MIFCFTLRTRIFSLCIIMQLSWKKNHCVIFMQYAFLLLRYTNTVYIFLVITKIEIEERKMSKRVKWSNEEFGL